MNTKNLPAIIMLAAGFLTCIIQIANGVTTEHFLKTLLIVLVCFYIIGSIIRVILDRTFKDMGQTETDDAKSAEKEKEELANADKTAETTENVQLNETEPEDVD